MGGLSGAGLALEAIIARAAVEAEEECAALLGIPAVAFGVAQGAVEGDAGCAFVWGSRVTSRDNADDRVLQEVHRASLKVSPYKSVKSRNLRLIAVRCERIAWHDGQEHDR